MSSDLFAHLDDAVRAEVPVALATVVAGPGTGRKLLVRDDRTTVGSLGTDGLDRAVARDAAAWLATGTSGTRHYGPDGQARATEVEVFVEAFAPPARLVIFGAVDFTAALASVGKLLGYHVVVCDPRSVFATEARFPMADEVVVEWPNRYLERVGAGLGPRDAVCVLTHDPKLDVPAITAALRTDVGYLGAMGSRRTTEERAQRLREHGLAEGDLERVRAPIGLDLGGASPQETAISIAAEIIAVRRGREHVTPLARATGPIHG